MADHKTPEVDSVTGIATTGHEWDGLRELNQPLPRWWLWIFYATIVFAIGYWIAYPAWPLVISATGGVLNWNSRAAVVEEIDALKASRGPMVDKLTNTEIAAISQDPGLLDFTLAYGKVAFKENCAPCHGAGGGGATGYPNLIDDDWLWGGTAADIAQTITHGIRNTDSDSRFSEMPAFGRDGTLTADQIKSVTGYVLQLAGLQVPPGTNLDEGKQVFAEQCVGCHGEEGKGMREVGAPNLTDKVWLYGSTPEAIANTVTNAHNSSMPAWGARLDPTTIKALTVYVHSLGGGE